MGKTKGKASKSSKEEEHGAAGPANGVPKSIQPNGSGVKLVVCVKPNSRANAVESIDDDAVSVHVAEEAKDGKANDALVEYLAEVLHVKKREVEVERGSKSHDKLISVSGITPSQTLQLLSAEKK